MKKIFNDPFGKSVLVFCLWVGMIFLFSFIENQTIKIAIGMFGFLLMLYSLTKKNQIKT